MAPRLIHHPAAQSPPLARLPFLVWTVIVVTLAGAFAGDMRIFSFYLTGWAWVVPFTIAGLRLARYGQKATFPIWLWAPWIFWVILYLVFFAQENALQRSLMLLCPLAVGLAVSSLRVDEETLKVFGHRLKQVAVFFFVMILVKLGVFLTGTLPEASGLAPQVMTAALLAAVFAVRYPQGEKTSLGYWALMAVVPVLAVTRTGIVAAAATLPLTLGPLKLQKRILIVGAFVLAGLGLFYTERFQHKMFYSGRGTLEDVTMANPDFRTSGRSVIWEGLQEEIDREPWLGHGANAQENYVRRYFGGITHPHNDWLRLLYDYGYVGTALFALAILGQLWHLWRLSRTSWLRRHWLVLSGALAFLPFVIFMVTDNIIMYAAFFGNLHFTMLGMAYAAAGKKSKPSPQYVVVERPATAASRAPAPPATLGPLAGFEKIPRR